MFTESTEVLTSLGWKKPKNLWPGMEVFSVDPVDSYGVFAKVEVVRSLESQQAVRITQGDLKYDTTMKSRIINKSQKLNNLYYSKIDEKLKNNKLITTAKIKIDNLKTNLAEAELTIWVSYFGNPVEDITYFDISKNNYPDRLGQLLNVAGLSHVKNSAPFGGNVTYLADIDDWLLSREVFPGSRKLPNWLYLVDSIQAARFVDEFRFALGSSLTSLNKSAADLLQVMYLKIGKALRLVKNSDKTYSLEEFNTDSNVKVSFPLSRGGKKFWSIKCKHSNVVARVNGFPVLLFCS